VDAEHGDPAAAIGLPLPAGNAAAAGDIGIHHHWLARPETASGRRFGDLGTEFVAHDARVIQEGMQARHDMEIGAADTDAADPHQRLTGSRRGNGAGLHVKLPGLAADDSFHLGHCWLIPFAGRILRMKSGRLRSVRNTGQRAAWETLTR
jgi:hypothetical protein